MVDMNNERKLIIEEALLESVSGGKAIEYCGCDICSTCFCNFEWPCFFQ